MATRRADASLQARIATVNTDLAQLALDLRNYGDRELSDVIERARRELMHPALTGPLNNVGVDHSAFRR